MRHVQIAPASTTHQATQICIKARLYLRVQDEDTPMLVTVSVALSFASLVLGLGQQAPIFGPDSSADVALSKVITDEFSAYIEGLRRGLGVVGFSLGIVNNDGSMEYKGWGSSSETGDAVNENVS